MKKILALTLSLVMMLALASCGGGKENETTPAVTTDPVTDAPATDAPVVQAVDPLDAFTKIWAAMPEEFRFAAGGGDAENMVMDGPGKFGLTAAEAGENINAMLGFPADLVSKIDSAASLMHMMNANTFTAGAYHFVDAADKDASVETIKSNILARQWMCGFPETLIIVDLGGNTLLSAFGNGQVVEAFKTTTLNTIEGAKLVVESPIG